MSNNKTLTGFDMVMALSESTINYQFSQLYKKNIIQKKWALLAGQVINPKNGEKPFYLMGDDDDFNSKKDRWIQLQKKIEEEEDYSLIHQLKEEKINFDFGWDTSISSPTIQIVDKDTQGLILKIRFKNGKLHYCPDKISAVRTYDLSGCTYAFYVPIGKLKINKDKMVMDAQSEMETVIRESGLSEEDFSIESLFLNFENADISTFDKKNSVFPEEATLPLQIAVQNYFNLTLTGSDHSFILGYGVNRKKINSTEKAMFQPTSTNFSTSYSSHINKETPVKGQYSAFNFLMMLNNHHAPQDQDSGVLPFSLIQEWLHDNSPTTDGVFTISKSSFDQYIEAMDQYVESVFKKNGDGMDTGNGFKDGVLICKQDKKRKDDVINIVYKVTREAIKGHKPSSGLEIRYKLEISIEVHIHAKFIIDAEVKKITLSTSGQYTHGDINEKGHAGYLSFIIKSGTQGKFQLDHDLSKPAIAFDKDPNLFSGSFWDILLQIIELVLLWPVTIVKAIINQIAVDLGTVNVNDQNDQVKKLNNIDVLNQTNKVILPLGKTYTYKNLRYLPEEQLVGYDISYAPENN